MGEAVIKEFLVRHPKNAEANERLGHVYRELKQFDKALEQFELAFTLDKDEFYTALNDKGTLLMELKRWVEAVPCFETCLFHFKLGADYHAQLGKCFTELKYKDLATYHYRQALANDKDNKDAMEALGLVVALQ